MSNQHEALRLADELDDQSTVVCFVQRSKAAAELRRLHASCEDYMQHKQRQDQRVLQLAERVLELKAQRDALLEALKSTGLFLHHCWCDVQMNDYSFDKLNQQMAVVDAAIAAEEGK